MSDSKNIHTAGYDQTDAYFAEKDREILAKKRAELDAARKSSEAESAKVAHWMKCPKCGGQLAEQQMDVVMVDVCEGCGGIYFDSGELGMLLEAKSGGVRKALKKLIG